MHVSAGYKPWKLAEMKTTLNCVTVFSSISDLSLMVALAPQATEHLTLHQLTSVYCICLTKTSMSVKWIKVLEIEAWWSEK